MKRICVVTAGHLASTPRMLKAADALHEAGYAVRMVCGEDVDWCIAAGDLLRAARPWHCDVVHWHRRTGKALYRRTRLRHMAYRTLAASVGPRRLGLASLAKASCRVASELIQKATAQPSDFIYGGTSGGLAVTALAAQAIGIPYALDLEDFHSHEQDDSPRARLAHRILEEVERRVLPGAAFLTAGSAPIADAYHQKYGVRPICMNNVFPLPADPPIFAPLTQQGLRMVWLSQMIGPNRGLEDAIRAVGLAGVRGELHLCGSPVPGYLENLMRLAGTSAPELTVRHHPSQPDRQPEDICRAYDVGLALEQAHVRNRDLCLCNKPFTYLLAGLAVAATDTQGQRPLIEDLGEGGILYKPGDAATLAAALKRWADDPDALLRAKRASWEAARRRWHWEHPLERGALLEAVSRVFSRKGGHANLADRRS